jgi:hypothetical protein
MSPLDSDEMRQGIVCVRFFLRRSEEIMIGNESDSGYDCDSISIYEIFIVACSPRGIPARLMRRRAATAAANAP